MGLMTDISDIPYAELVKDLGESLIDMGLCERGLTDGVVALKSGTIVADRRRHNAHFVRVITRELRRRGRELIGPFPKEG
jgi:hypothetical protein